jgi:hypothetical protein
LYQQRQAIQVHSSVWMLQTYMMPSAIIYCIALHLQQQQQGIKVHSSGGSCLPAQTQTQQ